MLPYCLKCKKSTEIINPVLSNTSNGRTMILSNVLYVVVKNQNLLKKQ